MRSYNTFLPLILLIGQGLCAQEPPPAADPPAAAQATPKAPVVVGKGQEEVPGQPGVVQDKHAFGVLPNYRTAEGDQPYSPLTARMKFKIAWSDTIDGPSFVLAALFSGISQANNTRAIVRSGYQGLSSSLRHGALGSDHRQLFDRSGYAHPLSSGPPVFPARPHGSIRHQHVGGP